MSGNTTTIALVRHAESHANVGHILGSHAGCTGLSDRGREQARQLRAALLETSVLSNASIAMTSRLAQAIETYEIISPAVGGGRLKAKHDCGFCDVHCGELDGAAEDDLVLPETIYSPVAPQGESWVGFVRRATRALTSLALAAAGSTAVVVTHGGVIKTSLRAYGGRRYHHVEDDIGYGALAIWEKVVDNEWTLIFYGESNSLMEGIHAPLP